jgi:hypothetical protein
MLIPNSCAYGSWWYALWQTVCIPVTQEPDVLIFRTDSEPAYSSNLTLRIQIMTSGGVHKSAPMILTRSASINKIYIPIWSFCRASIKPGECPPHDLLGADKWLSEELWSASHSNALSISDLPQFCTPLWGGSWVAADCQLEDKEVMDGEWYTHTFPESSQSQTSRNPLHQQGIWNT